MPLSGKMFVKQRGTELEVELQTIASKYYFAPRISNIEKNGQHVRIHMEDVEELCLADAYGDDPKDIPEWIWDDIREIITTLYEEEGIEYVDITPYNFIEKDGKIYIIDFGDARYNTGPEIDWFLTEFIYEEKNCWNPDYK